MKTVTMLDLRMRAESIIKQVRKGQSLVLSYRGKPAMRLMPIHDEDLSPDDLFYKLTDLAQSEGKSLSNAEIDALIYEG